MTNKPEKPNVIWAANGTNTDPGDQLFEQGWPFTDGQGSPQPPESGVMNYIQNKSSQFLAHVNEYGIAQWDADTIYPIGAYASSSVTNRVYISTANNNQNNEPSAGVGWAPFGTVGGIGDTLVSYSGDVDMESRGFLPQDGRAISRTTYSELFALVGTTFGEGDGSTTFNVPDKPVVQQSAFTTIPNNPHPNNEIYLFKKNPTENELIVAFDDISDIYTLDLDTNTWDVLPTPTGTSTWASKSPAYPNNPRANFVYNYGTTKTGRFFIFCRVDGENPDFIFWQRESPVSNVNPNQWITDPNAYRPSRLGFNTQEQMLNPSSDDFIGLGFQPGFNYINVDNGLYQYANSVFGGSDVRDPDFFNPPGGDYILSNSILVEKNTGKTYLANSLTTPFPEIWQTISNDGPFEDFPNPGGTITNASMTNPANVFAEIIVGPNANGEYYTKRKYNEPTNGKWIFAFRYISPDTVRCWDYREDGTIFISIGNNIIYNDTPAAEVFNDYIKVSA